MCMNISLNWLQEYITLPADILANPSRLEPILTMLGLEVEGIEQPALKYQHFYIGYVQECVKHPSADKLSVCTVTLDGTTSRTIICGAPNVSAGQHVVVAIEGAIVPNGGFAIGKRKIRGIESNGMICSQAELDLGDDTGGIWVLPETAPVGSSFADFMGMNDVVFEIGITPNRADCLSHIGIARELSAYFDIPLHVPKLHLHEQGTSAENEMSVTIHNPELCRRFVGRVVRGVKIGESPAWLKARMQATGLRSINNVVDVTNFVMLECGKPIHAFDMNTLRGRAIHVRSAHDGETFITLDNKERTLQSGMVMIADAERAVAVGGVMGGLNSEITDTTTDVFIETAYFHPSAIRRTAKTLGIQSDASYRFERGVDMGSLLFSADRAAQLIQEVAGGEIAPGMIDIYPSVLEQNTITLRFAKARTIIGVEIENDHMIQLLVRLGFTLQDRTSDRATFLAPTWRVDIEQEFDLIEEIARLYHYDNIPPATSSHASLEMSALPKELAPPHLSKRVSNYLVANGFLECLSQELSDPTSSALITSTPIRLANPLGEEMSVMRPSLIPSMLRIIERNLRYNATDLRLFEIGKTYRQANKEKTPLHGVKETIELIIALAGSTRQQWDTKPHSYDFYDIKGIAESLSAIMRVDDITFVPNEEQEGVYALFAPSSVRMMRKKQEIGIAGDIAPTVRKQFGIDIPIALAVFNLELLSSTDLRKRTYTPISPYPVVQRDVAFVVDKATASEHIRQTIATHGGEFLRSVHTFDVFEHATLGDNKKSIAYNITFNSSERTLLDHEVESAMKNIIDRVTTDHGGILRA